jgi:hypothetical protein
MGDRDPVSWETKVAALGSPASEIEEYVEEMGDDVQGRDPYDAVKAIHDALSEDFAEADRTVPGLGEVFVTAYLLEREGIIAPDSNGLESEYRSLVGRRAPRRTVLEARTDALVDRCPGRRPSPTGIVLALRGRYPADGAELHGRIDGTNTGVSGREERMSVTVGTSYCSVRTRVR